ncbi:YbhB/YbcL family Raf kinase inhibitor-like protein [Nocardia sp. NBC_01730]|uniref:YbhB/YbcL family Raf kinase inhibitor-like protein n=1 Tax=Nocardia sp. NBC_01730 TaxID=2975998 RepID=UPI002E10D1BB|nr:YbhB/YbcL family Raf kinase inhibitor-like protein [Nocardia sp. NBC_01730]
MPDPGSHRDDVRRTRLRTEDDDTGVPDQPAHRGGNEDLQQRHPPSAAGDPERAAGTHDPSRGDPAPGESPTAKSGSPIELHSTAFSDRTLIPKRHSYDGENIAPPLDWSGIPSGTEEIVLLCEDPDAPTGLFTHWVLTGMAPTATGVSADATPPGAVASRNDFGEVGWSGPRPPVGDDPHRYFFRLYAIDRRLGCREAATGDEVRNVLSNHVLATGTLVGLFRR